MIGNNIDVREFINKNITPYVGDDTFLSGTTTNTQVLWDKVSKMIALNEIDVDLSVVGDITSHGAGYIYKELEKIVGLQSEKALQSTLMPHGGLRPLKNALHSYNKELPKDVDEIFTNHVKTHNDGVFDLYTDDIRKARKSGLITGLPDSYSRGRIIGDYRRVALYGVDYLIESKLQDKDSLDRSLDPQLVEEVASQIKALRQLKELGTIYGFDISKPATTAQECIQWLYLGYLAAIKQQNGAAMSLGRTASFIDIFIEQDLKKGLLTEKTAQELIDQFIMKLRMVRFLRAPAYNELFSGDPVWVTESLGGMLSDGRTNVTKTSFRYLQTLYNLGASPEPNLTVLWNDKLPTPWKEFVSKVSLDTSAIQYEDDVQMSERFGDDYSIACCVSGMTTGKEMQFFGARVNLAKTLLYAINGGADEISGVQIIPGLTKLTGVLNPEEVKHNLKIANAWLAKTYISALNIIHFMHDKYAYESLQMGLHDTHVKRTMACGIAGLSVCADSLSAINTVKVTVNRNEGKLAFSRNNENFSTFGNNNNEVDTIACDIVSEFHKQLQNEKTYRGSKVTQSVLTITSNVVYGKKTGETPDGRLLGEPFAPGANPMHGRERNGIISAMSSVAKLPYDSAEDGISYTFSSTPKSLGKDRVERIHNLLSILHGYFGLGGQHININVFDRETLEDAVLHPELYPSLTIRVSGYAVRFVALTKAQQQEVIARTIF